MYQYFDCVPYHKLIQDIKHLHFQKFLMCYWCKQWRLFIYLFILLDFVSPITCLNVSKMRATIFFLYFIARFKYQLCLVILLRIKFFSNTEFQTLPQVMIQNQTRVTPSQEWEWRKDFQSRKIGIVPAQWKLLALQGNLIC